MIEGNFLTPKLVGDSVGLHPLWVFFALLAGGSLLGILGMFLAVPVAAVVGVRHMYLRGPTSLRSIRPLRSGARANALDGGVERGQDD